MLVFGSRTFTYRCSVTSFIKENFVVANGNKRMREKGVFQLIVDEEYNLRAISKYDCTGSQFDFKQFNELNYQFVLQTRISLNDSDDDDDARKRNI